MNLKILQINTVYGYGSTGKIANKILRECETRGIECRVAHRYLESEKALPNTYQVSSYIDCHIHNRLARITHLTGCFSRIKTAVFLRKIDKYSPDIIHLHNLHGNYINISMLFKYIKKKGIPIVWTLHDCWSFTGFCPHYTMIGCDKWKSGCKECPLRSCVRVNRYMYKQKKKWFSDIENMTIVTPSRWLSDQVKESFLKDYSKRIINNGIDLNVFNPIESDFRKKNSCENKKIVLGVAFGWDDKKGLDVFVELTKRLDEQYQIVLVGTNEEIDRLLPKNIISIHRTQNQRELAEIYTAADVFVNPTREDTYPTVNMEAIACGTPVVTFKTGGSPEILDSECGATVDVDDIDSLEEKIKKICNEKVFYRENCVEKAKAFDMGDKFYEYVKLYEEIAFKLQNG